MSKKVFYNAKSKYKVRVVDVTYRQDQEGSWAARIYLPEKHGPFPALFDVHGGVWTRGGCTDNEIIDLSLLIIRGTDDSNVPLATVDRFSEAYRAAGGAVDIKWFPHMPHGFACKPGAETDRALEMIKDFICRQLT